MRYTNEQLMEMPINLLRGIDIRDTDEETQVQAVLNVRLKDMPIAQEMSFPSSVTDSIKTVEDEKKYQAIMDAKRAEAKARLTTGDGLVEEENVPEPVADPILPPEDPAATPSEAPLPDPTKPADPIDPPQEEADGKVKFCDHCDSKGRFHKKECTRPRE